MACRLAERGKATRCSMPIAAALLIVSPTVRADDPGHGPPIDAYTLDLAGVRLGMNRNQAVAALARNFGVPPAQVRIGTSRQEDFVYHRTDLAETATVESGDARVHVAFEPRIPPDPSQPEIVVDVRYEAPEDEAGKARLKASALAKYGPPTTGFENFAPGWCLLVDDTCRQNEQAVLTYHGSYLTLFDWHYAVAEQAFSDRKYRWLPRF